MILKLFHIGAKFLARELEAIHFVESENHGFINVPTTCFRWNPGVVSSSIECERVRVQLNGPFQGTKPSGER